MIAYNDIRDLHLEISSLCNAACPWCPRTFWGYPYNGGYPETNLTLDQVQQIFPRDFIQRLRRLRVNGNFGDIVMNPQGPDIVQFFRDHNPDLEIEINTNGGARSADFWRSLAKADALIKFALDGLEDTHHLYRQNTSWATVVKNAKIFIDNGGRAIWQMIRFAHNQHQISECRALSQQLGFQEFALIHDGRDTGPVFDRQGQLVHVMGDYTGPTSFPMLFEKKRRDRVLLEDIVQERVPSKYISCEAQRMASIYVAANGDVSPCCYTGFYPRSYGHGQYHEAANQQLVPLLQENNALEFDLEHCIQWFHGIQSSWQHATYQQGRLVICDDNCGSQTSNTTHLR
jgi:MoaA/NifB/PqqE/SkfB family radical SAM enzyme